MGCSHCLRRFSASESCPFSIPSWFPSIQAPTDSAIPSSQCFLPQSLHRCLCILHCYGSHCFSVPQAFIYSLPCLDEVLQLSVHPDHRHPFGPTFLTSRSIRFSHIRFSNRFCNVTVPRSCSPSLGFYGVVRQQHGSWLFRRRAVDLWWEIVELTLIDDDGGLPT
jgi:hypothetical protein